MKKLKKLMTIIMVTFIATTFVACKANNETSNTKDNSTSKNVASVDSENFPKFKGTDFDGNEIDESIFKKNKVTVLNFWFNGCSACVNEMPALEKFNKTLKENGAEIVGVNVEAADSKKVLEEAKRILSKQGASYRNIMIEDGKEAKELIGNMIAFPTTILVDQNGKIIGSPITGNIDNEKDENKILEVVKKVSEGKEISKEDFNINESEAKEEVEDPEIIALSNEMNEIFAKNNDMWGKILDNAPKDKISQIGNEITYEDYLNEALEKTKDSITTKEFELAKKDIKKIVELDSKIKELDKKNK